MHRRLLVHTSRLGVAGVALTALLAAGVSTGPAASPARADTADEAGARVADGGDGHDAPSAGRGTASTGEHRIVTARPGSSCRGARLTVSCLRSAAHPWCGHRAAQLRRARSGVHVLDRLARGAADLVVHAGACRRRLPGITGLARRDRLLEQRRRGAVPLDPRWLRRRVRPATTRPSAPTVRDGQLRQPLRDARESQGHEGQDRRDVRLHQGLPRTPPGASPRSSRPRRW